MAEFNYPDINWKNNGVTHMLSMKFSACIEDCFLMEMLDVPARSEVLLDLLLTKEKKTAL